jgi:hypothetical protein
MSILSLLPVATSVTATTPKGYEQYQLAGVLSFASPPAGFTIPSGATSVRIVSEDNIFRWRDDGTPASAALGEPVAGGTVFVYAGTLTNLSIAPVGPNATLNFSFYG